MNYPPQAPIPPNRSPNIVLAIVSLALGLVGLFFMIPTILFTLCGIVSIAFGIAAVITGLIAKSRSKSDPVNWGGGGLAIGGVIVGIISVIAPIGYIILWMILVFGIMAAGQAGR